MSRNAKLLSLIAILPRMEDLLSDKGTELDAVRDRGSLVTSGGTFQSDMKHSIPQDSTPEWFLRALEIEDGIDHLRSIIDGLRGVVQRLELKNHHTRTIIRLITPGITKKLLKESALNKGIIPNTFEESYRDIHDSLSAFIAKYKS